MSSASVQSASAAPAIAPDERIIKYYLLCTVKNGSKRHIVTEMADKTRGNMITKKDIDVFLRPHGADYAVRDSVVGGGDGVDYSNLDTMTQTQH